MYTGILAAIVAILSGALYEFHSNDVGTIERQRERHAERPFDEVVAPIEPAPGIAEYLERLGRSILLADLITIGAGGALSAFLAGRTLRPIRLAVEGEKAFFSNAAHDLRTPLAVMQSEAEVALREEHLAPGAARQVIASSLEEIEHMSSMVEQMLDLARSGGQRSAAVLVPLDLADIARSMVKKLGRRAEEHGISLTVETAGEARVQGDAISLQRALGNVLENSLAYTPRGGSVVVRVQRAGAHVMVHVEDTGIGIAAEDLPLIAEPFFRGDRARSAHTGGAGLGLTIVKSTIGEHGGTFGAESRLGGGTIISLRFPAR